MPVQLVDKPTREQRLENAIKQLNLAVQSGQYSSSELQVYSHTLTQAGLLKDGEKSVYGTKLPWYVKNNSAGSAAFMLRENAMAFQDLVRREYPTEGYGTTTTLRDPEPGGKYYYVDYEIHDIDWVISGFSTTEGEDNDTDKGGSV